MDGLRLQFGSGEDEGLVEGQAALPDDDFGIRRGDRELNGFSAFLGNKQGRRPVVGQMACGLGADEQVEHLLTSKFHRQPPIPCKHFDGFTLFSCRTGLIFFDDSSMMGDVGNIWGFILNSSEI